MRKSRSKFKLWFDRLLSKSLIRQLAFLAVLLVIALGLSYLLLSLSGAEWGRFCAEKKVSKWLLPLYLLIDSNALNNLYITDEGPRMVHRWMLIASTITFLIGAFIFNGAIIGIITNSIERRVESHRKGLFHYLKSGHYVILGYDAMVPSIINCLFKKDPKAFVLLMSAADTEYVTEKLKKSFNEKQLKSILVNYGHRMSTDYYKDIHLESASEIFIVGLRPLSAHDATNVECVDSICRYLNQKEVNELPRRITCVFEDIDTYEAFKTTEIFGEVKKLGIEFVPYNYYYGWAKQVFINRCYTDVDGGEIIKYPTVYGNGITPDDKKYVHLVFIGITYFAEALARQAANVLHFPNFNTDPRLKTLISFIDINAAQEINEFIVHNRHIFQIQSYYFRDLSDNAESDERIKRPPTYFNQENGYGDEDRDFLDVEFEFVQGNIFSRKVQCLIREWALDKEGQYLSIFLPMSDQRRNFAFGMNLPDEVYDNEIPVFIRQDKSDNFITNLRKMDKTIVNDTKRNTYSFVQDGKLQQKVQGGRYSNIYPFGMNESAFSADNQSLKMAKLINYLYFTADYAHYKFKEIPELEALPDEQIWNEAEGFWRELTIALKWSCIYNAYTIQTKLSSLFAMRGLDIDTNRANLQPLTEEEVDVMARVEHNRWNVERLFMGFRKPHREEDKYRNENAAYVDALRKNKNRFIHHDIRPYDNLDNIRELDAEYSRYIPWLLQMVEPSNKS